MNFKTCAFALLIFLLSCNSADKKDSSSTETQNTTTGNSSTDVEAKKAELNRQSKACIAIMNSLDEELRAAQASGDGNKASAIQARIDSAAMENAKIGQQLMALDK